MQIKKKKKDEVQQEMHVHRKKGSKRGSSLSMNDVHITTQTRNNIP